MGGSPRGRLSFYGAASGVLPPAASPFFRIRCFRGLRHGQPLFLWALEYYYDSRKEGASRTDEEHYQALRRLVGGRAVRCVVVDPSAASFMEVIQRHGEYPVVPARNEVLDGIRQTASALQQGRIRICNTCRDAMREFSLYRWEERGDRDVPVKEHDHAMDDIRYFVSTLLGLEGDACYALASFRESPSLPSLETLSFAEFEKGERL